MPVQKLSIHEKNILEPKQGATVDCEKKNQQKKSQKPYITVRL